MLWNPPIRFKMLSNMLVELISNIATYNLPERICLKIETFRTQVLARLLNMLITTSRNIFILLSITRTKRP
jgi:hypothetical protein